MPATVGLGPRPRPSHIGADVCTMSARSMEPLFNPMDMAMFAPAGDGMRGGVHMCNRPGATANCWFHTMLLSRLRRRMATATELTEVWRGHYCRKLCIDIHASMFVLALARARVQIWGLCICSCPGAPLKRNKRPVGTIFVQVYV